jgi:ribose transport system substrate-binding protein
MRSTTTTPPPRTPLPPDPAHLPKQIHPQKTSNRRRIDLPKMRKRSSGTLALARRFLRVRILWLALVVAATAGTTAHAQENDGNDNETEAVYYEPYNQVGGILLTQSSNTENPIKIGFINGGSTFFQPVLEGYRTTCQELDLTCYAAEFSKTNSSVGNQCVFKELTSMKWLQEEGIHGLALKPCTAEYNAFLGNFTAAKVPVVFFDSDVESMKEHRIAYVGTEQRRMGVVMARVLRQQRPEGGTFGITLGKDGRTEGFMEEIMKDNDRDDRAHWYPAEGNDLTVDGSLFNTSSWEQKYSLRMEWFAQRNTTAIVSFRQTPMKIPNWKQVVDKYRDRNITYLGVDAADFQLEYLNQRYVDGLVGQSPWMIGKTVVDVLVKYRREGKVDQDFIPTNLIAYNMIPLELPDLQFEKNLLGNLSWLGISLFIVVAMVATTCITWTLYYQKSSLVVGAAQPFFLVTIAAGVLIMSASLIPLSFDDGGDINSLSDREKVFRCMTIPWLSFTGFSVVFSALFAKTLRINKLMASSNSFARVQVDVKDVMGVFSLIMFCNVLVLTLWTVIDPLMYTRSWNDGTDYWNREFSSSGSCSCDRPGAYLTPLAISKWRQAVKSYG